MATQLLSMRFTPLRAKTQLKANTQPDKLHSSEGDDPAGAKRDCLPAEIPASSSHVRGEKRRERLNTSDLREENQQCTGQGTYPAGITSHAQESSTENICALMNTHSLPR